MNVETSVAIQQLPQDVVSIAERTADHFGTVVVKEPLIGFLRQVSNISGLNGIALETWLPTPECRMGLTAYLLMSLTAAYKQDPVAMATYSEAEDVYLDWKEQFELNIPDFFFGLQFLQANNPNDITENYATELFEMLSRRESFLDIPSGFEGIPPILLAVAKIDQAESTPNH